QEGTVMAQRMMDDLYPRMPWDRLDAVVFDVGGVLLDMDPAAVLEALYPGQAALHKALIEKMIRTPYWNMLDAGSLDLEEAIQAMTGRNDELAEPIRRFMTQWPSFNVPIEEGVEAARACKKHGKRLYLLSNYPDEHFAYNERTFDFFNLFDGRIISARERQLKPKPGIYELAERRFSLIPERTLFIDDTPANLEEALRRGWQVFCLSRPGKLGQWIAEDGL
ncbi:MAG: HAD family phosphatase, partial [Eubacteriales bacterium]|nr:HAD family phosphatase [Eubacteriales bacterium]